MDLFPRQPFIKTRKKYIYSPSTVEKVIDFYEKDSIDLPVKVIFKKLNQQRKILCKQITLLNLEFVGAN